MAAHRCKDYYDADGAISLTNSNTAATTTTTTNTTTNNMSNNNTNTNNRNRKEEDDDEGEEDEIGDFEDWVEQDDVGNNATLLQLKRTKCLFSNVVHETSSLALKAAKDEYGFCLRQFLHNNNSNSNHHHPNTNNDDDDDLEFYNAIKVINFIRKMVSEEQKTIKKMMLEGEREKDDDLNNDKKIAEKVLRRIDEGAWKDDVYLMPVDTSASDPLSYEWESYVYEVEEEEDVHEETTDENNKKERRVNDDDNNNNKKNLLMISSLQNENEQLKLKVFEMMEKLGMISEEEERKKLAPIANVGANISKRVNSPNNAAIVGEEEYRSMKDYNITKEKERRQAQNVQDDEEMRVRDSDDNYFNSYSYFEIHKDMLSDQTRTDAYRDALTKNPTLMNGANVLDVGCGTGILSMFAARDGGARNVVGVDGSYRIADVARMNVGANDLREKVEIIEGKLEDMETIDAAPFDIIVSEWMGYGLFFESMLDTVLYARDKYLKPGGALLPDVCCIKIAGFTKKATVDFDFWNDVYGFTMKEVAVQQMEHALATAVVKHIEGEHIGTTETEILRLDLCKCSAKDTEFSAEFELNMIDASKSETIYGIALWFDTEFSSRFCKENPVVLSTSPKEPKTHWVQTALHFPEPIVLDGASALSIKGRISMAKSPEHVRGYDISLESFKCDANGNACGEVSNGFYRL